MSAGEYIDLDSNIDKWESMHKAMAVLFRPILKQVGNKYSIEEYVGSSGELEFQNSTHLSELLRFMPLDIVIGARVFFYHLGNELLKTTRSYLIKETMKMISPKSGNSTNSGDGTTQSMHSLEESLKTLTELPDFHLPKLLHT
jgi:hypothetical protein